MELEFGEVALINSLDFGETNNALVVDFEFLLHEFDPPDFV